MLPLNMRYFMLLLWIIYRSGTSLNPCMIDRDACLPIEDFEVNCTCILTAKEPFNDTDDIFMYFMGHQFPLYLFRQIFREKLDLRIPSERDFQPSLELPDTIYKNLRFEEKVALFLANSSASAAILHHLINESYIQTPELRENSDKWCAEGECAAFVHREAPFNRSAGIYAHTADLLHIIEMRGRSIFAVSSVYAEFDVPKVHKIVCGHKCGRFYWNEGVLCRQRCAQRSVIFTQKSLSNEDITTENSSTSLRTSCLSRRTCSLVDPFGFKVVIENTRIIHSYLSVTDSCSLAKAQNLSYDQIAVTGDLRRAFVDFVRASAIYNFRLKYSKYLGKIPREHGS